MLKKQYLLILLTISTLSLKSFGQGGGNSPYSAIGVGEPSQTGYSTSYGAGGVGVSYADGIHPNGLNPALIVKNHYTVFDFGLIGNVKTISNDLQTQKSFGMNIGYIAIAFPVRPRWTTSMAFQPYSSVDAESRYTKKIAGSVSDTVQYFYKSLGGVSKLSWRNGFQIGKSLFVGFDANYYFGSIKRDTTTHLVLNDGQDYYLLYSDNIAYKGVGLKGGIAYQQKINKDWQINIGATYEMQSSLKGTGLKSFSTLTTGTNGPSLLKSPDTLSISRGSINLPDKYSIGISLEKNLKWYFSADYSVQSWTKFRNYLGKADPNYTDGSSLSLGIEYLPNATSTKYLNQTFFRVGYQSSKTPFVVNGIQITDHHVSFGTSMPLNRRSLNYANISLVLGTRGTTLNSLVQENYFRVVLGFTLNDLWFQKVRVD